MVAVRVESSRCLDLIGQKARETNDEGYAEVVCAVPFSHYERRVEELGFVDMRRVLDVGCGFGHWSAALAARNGEVEALDQHPARVEIAREVAACFGLENVYPRVGDALALPFPDASFDGLFCYGVFMFLDRDRAFEEFRRVLRPGGRLYVCTNARGWWLRLWLQSLRGNPHVRKAAFAGWWRGGQGKPPHAISRRGARRLLPARNWTDVQTAFEGCLGAPSAAETAVSYPGRWAGLDCVIEFSATKPADAERAVQPADPLVLAEVEGAVTRTLHEREYEYLRALRRFPQPRPALDLVNNSDPAVVGRALERGRAVNRPDVLRSVYERIVAGTMGEEEQVVACVTFAQKHFFHHFAGQPMTDGVSVLDPVASLLLAFGRCGTSARFLVDMFECNGTPARLAAGACHTWAEVLCGRRWVIADASLFPPGVLPRNREGALLSPGEALAEPDLLNRVPSYVNYHHAYLEGFFTEYPETRAELEEWLVAPLLPSSGYFGRDFYAGSGREPGTVERFRKTGSAAIWSADANFGWGGVDVEATVSAGCPVEQRPGQVTSATLAGDRLTWDAPAAIGTGPEVSYRVVCADRSRGWDYDALPIGCDFATPGFTLTTAEPWVRLDALGHGTHFSIIAENPAWSDREIFYLPSTEFELSALATARDSRAGSSTTP